MNVEQLTHQVVINEWQLGQQLNAAVHHNCRDKFNLLLSFLSEDAQDFAQFDKHAKNEREEVAQPSDLRAYFKLPAAQPLTNEGPSELLLAEFNDDLHQANMLDIHFKQLLINEALLCKQKSTALPNEVLDNLTLLKQQKVSELYKITERAQNETAMGIDANLLDEYKDLDLANRPLKVHYA